MSDLMKFFQARKGAYHTNARLIDDVIYTPYGYDDAPAPANGPQQQRDRDRRAQVGDLLGVPELAPGQSTSNGANAVAEADQRTSDHAMSHKRKKSKFEEVPTEAEIFMFQYGTVVIWGMTEAEEKRFLSSM